MSGGIPTIGIALICVGVLGILTWIFLIVSDSAQGEVDWDPRNSYIVALDLYEDASYSAATDRLNKIDDEKRRTMGPELQKKFKELEELLAQKEQDTDQAAANMLGTEWKSTQLDRFRNDRLSGKNPPRERVRVYLKRVKEFKTRWPRHPELQEVLRYEALFKEICDLSEPATYSEIAYEVKTMTWAKPRNYKGAFVVVERHLAANPGDKSQCEALLATMRTEQADHFNEMMLQAKYDWEKDQRGQAVAGLIQLITLLEDDSLSDQAAEELVRLPGIDEWLRGYKSGRPEKFREITQHPTVAAKARELGL